MTPDAHVEIDAMLASLIDRWNRHDVPEYVSFWLEDGDFVNVIGTHHHGRDQLQAELEWLHGGRFRNTQIRDLGHSIRFLSPDLAIIHMHWHMDGDPGMPGHPSDDGVRRGIFTHVAQRTSQGGWRFVASQNTDIVSVPAIPGPPA
jgi:uncharacterized protein (TIGR02246 family)